MSVIEKENYLPPVLRRLIFFLLCLVTFDVTKPSKIYGVPPCSVTK